MILECKDLCKQYGKGPMILQNLNVAVPEGKIIGLLGPNGCGKTTLIKMICGILQPTSGAILVDGAPPGPDSCARISYLPERPYFDPGMRVRETLAYFADFYPDFRIEEARRMLADLHIDQEARMRTLSKGTREKVQLVLVMSRKARLYLLDEPIAGVDPASRDYILRTILQHYSPDSSILITTHLIRDVEAVLDEFVFMGYGGQIVAYGDAEEVRRKEGRSLDEIFREVFRYVPQTL
ncbi:MAG: ABC transporter ATP-binding protein [Clostridia bacterium]|nr:ABC transporter ATP-binding protein [Clostridia bacterium]